MMDWQECIKKRIVKDVSQDMSMISGLKMIIEDKVSSSNILPEENYYSKITLIYDALRIILECIALKAGYKIYNHECYTPFLKEIMNLPQEADSFDRLRVIRNGINYYGRQITKEEAVEIIEDVKELIDKLSGRI